MAALTGIRDTKKLQTNWSTQAGPKQKASTKIWGGALVVLNGGYCAPGTTATGLVALGRASKTSDNSSGADGAITALYESGIFKWDNSSAGDAIAQTDVGAQCFIVDDHTVAKTNGSSTRSVAGIIYQVDTDGVWVQTGLGMNS